MSPDQIIVAAQDALIAMAGGLVPNLEPPPVRQRRIPPMHRPASLPLDELFEEVP